MEYIDRRRSRSLASEQRAGSWLRRRAVEQQYQFLRENPRVVLVLVAIYVVLLPGAWFLPSWGRGFFVGAWTATIGWLGVLLTWQLSGVGYLQQGELAEQWTVQQLTPLTKRGWHLINHVLFRPWDIDHILLGPAGVIVIETKGGNSDWTEVRHQPRIRDAVRQAKDNAGDARRFLRSAIGDAPVYPVVALWPGRDEVPTRDEQGVTVLSGHRLRSWVESLPDRGLDENQAAAGWRRISDHLERRDAHETERHGRAPRTMERLALDFAQYPMGMALSVILVPRTVELMTFPVSLFFVLGIASLAAIGARRFSGASRLLRGAALGAMAYIFTVAVFLVADLIA